VFFVSNLWRTEGRGTPDQHFCFIFRTYPVLISVVLLLAYSELSHAAPMCVSFCSLVSWGGVRLSPIGTSATNSPIVPALGDRWWMWSSLWNENWQRKPKYSEKTYPIATLSTTNPTWPDLGSNPGRRGGKPATNRLSYGTALLLRIKLRGF
jgi:hypothetical protein